MVWWHEEVHGLHGHWLCFEYLIKNRHFFLIWETYMKPLVLLLFDMAFTMTSMRDMLMEFMGKRVMDCHGLWLGFEKHEQAFPPDLIDIHEAYSGTTFWFGLHHGLPPKSTGQ
jgi:hypothetical protein